MLTVMAINPKKWPKLFCVPQQFSALGDFASFFLPPSTWQRLEPFLVVTTEVGDGDEGGYWI